MGKQEKAQKSFKMSGSIHPVEPSAPAGSMTCRIAAILAF
jgi:hypothetical protein